MNSALYFLLVVAVVSIAGSVILGLRSKQRRPVDPSFSEQLKALAPDRGSPAIRQTSGIVPVVDDQAEENSTGT